MDLKDRCIIVYGSGREKPATASAKAELSVDLYKRMVIFCAGKEVFGSAI
jgi:hypothetical protein